MPGRTPAQAVAAFLDPLQQAVSCLGTCKLVLSPNARSVGKVHLWTLCPAAGLRLQSVGLFKARMQFEIVTNEHAETPADRWRVSTRGYYYDLDADDHSLRWAMHWHPYTGTTQPHFHIPAISEHGHLAASARHTLEMAVRWCIEMGAEPTRSDWATVLTESEGIHELWRSWR